MSLAILPGSYDPITLGHLDLIRCAAERYDEIVVAVMVNAAKKTMLTTNQAISIAGIANTNKRSNNETKPVIIKPPHFV